MAAPIQGSPPSLSFQLILLLSIICFTYSSTSPSSDTVGKLLTKFEEGNPESLRDLLREMAAVLARQDSQNKDQQVAFSASLGASVEEVSEVNSAPTVLIFKEVETNIGNAYDSNTGYFTAPVRGTYMFQWHVETHYSGSGSAIRTFVPLFKNKFARMFGSFQYTSADYSFDSSSQSITLPLQAGDNVHLKLWSGDSVYDDSSHLSTFSGHLLFLM